MKTIELTKGAIALIDDEDYGHISQISWSLGSAGYALGWYKGKMVSMHRFLLGAKAGEQVDHRNRNRLDNRRANLRFCTAAQQRRNSSKPHRPCTSRYRGVHWRSCFGRWRASIRVGDGKRLELGLFKDERDAARAYNEAARKYHGEFACLNLIEQHAQQMQRGMMPPRP